MKDYLRILRYAQNLKQFLPVFTLFSLFAGVFGVLNLIMLKPLLDVLFGNIPESEVKFMAEKSIGTWDILPYFQKIFAQTVINKGKLAALKGVCLTIIVLTFLANVFRYLSLRLLEKFKSTMVYNLRKSIFSHILKLDLSFFSSEKKGTLISYIITDVQEVENSIANSFSAAIKELVLLIAYLVALFAISWKLTLFSLVVIPITGGFLGIILKKMRNNAGETQEKLGSLMSIMEEVFNSMRIVKGFGAEEYITQKFDQDNLNYKKAIFNYAKKRELANPFSEFVGVSMVAGLLFYGGSMILDGNSSLAASTFIAYMALFSQVVRPAKEISQAIGSAQRGLVSARRILDILDKNSTKIVSGNIKKVFEKEIVFKNLNFSYNSNSNVEILKSIDLKIKKGQTIALVGGSGGGKSTIADLFMRFYDPTAGEISLDGVPLSEVDLMHFRNEIGIVPQEPSLFNDSIYENISFGRDTNAQEIENAAKIANAYNFILETQDGFNTNIGDRGNKLSGGQKQRISIARAILKNPAFLILDEATSALDTESERLVQEALNGLMKNRTTLVIAHRLSTIQSADYIYVINKGEIIEHGTHSSLLENVNGYYTKLINLQNFR
jgi:ATP-binding cassette, subfamily B, bacterial MsbA